MEGIARWYLHWFYLTHALAGDYINYIRNPLNPAHPFTRCLRFYTPFTMSTQPNISCLIDVFLLCVCKQNMLIYNPKDNKQGSGTSSYEQCNLARTR